MRPDHRDLLESQEHLEAEECLDLTVPWDQRVSLETEDCKDQQVPRASMETSVSLVLLACRA